MDKVKLIKQLIHEMSLDTSIEDISVKRKGETINLGLVNQFKISKEIPNKWFDWTKRVDAKVMIIGQDWGPYSSLQKYFDEYELNKYLPDFNYNEFLFSMYSSRTEKFIFKTLSDSFREKYNREITLDDWNDFFFTMAVLFTRQGNHFRGNGNFDEKQSAELSYKYLVKQIEIIQPKVILTMGNLAFQSVNTYFDLGYEGRKISEVIKDLEPKGYISKNNTVIIPNYHPAAHIPPTTMKKLWSLVWDHI